MPRTDFADTFTRHRPVGTGAERRRAEHAARRRHLRVDRRRRRARAGDAGAPRPARALGPAVRPPRPEPRAVAAGRGRRRGSTRRAAGEGVIKLILSRGVEHGPAPTAWVTAAAAADNTAVREHGIRVVTLDRGLRQRHARAGAVAAARREDAVVRGQHGGDPRGEAPGSRRRDLRVVGRLRARGARPRRSSCGSATASSLRRPNGGILHGTTQLSLFEHLEAQGLETAYETIPVERAGAGGCRVARVERAPRRADHRDRRRRDARSTPSSRHPSIATC